MSLRIGMCSIDITPPAPIPLAGQFRLRVGREVESPLLANAFAIENADEQLIICACDLGSLNASLVELIRKTVADRCPDIDTEKLIISAIHTHTGPIVEPQKSYTVLDPKYLPDGIHVIPNLEFPEDMWNSDKCCEWVAQKAADAICRAWEGRDHGYFSASFGRAVVGHCRRAIYTDGTAKLFGTTQTNTFHELEASNDTGVELLYAFDKNKKPIGALVNVACPAQCVEDMSYISSDYWGKVRDFVHKEINGDFVVVGLCAAAGDQCPVDLVRRYRGNAQFYRRSDTFNMENHIEGATEIGKRLGREIAERLPEAAERMKDEATVKNQAVTVDFPIRKVTQAEYEQALSNLRAKVKEYGTVSLSVSQACDLHIYAGVVKRYIQQNETPTLPGEVHVARIDDVAIATNPFELFIDYGNRIRGASPAAQTFLVQLACGAGGYLPTEKAEKGGHYSAYVSSGTTGHEGGDLLVAKTLSMIRDQFDL